MPGYSSYDVVGTKQSVSDVISNLSPTKTPFQTMVGTKKIKSRKHEWQEDSLAAVRDNAEVEGFDATDVNLLPTVMRDNNTQIHSKTIRVTATADEIDNYGRDREMAYQLRKASQELKRDHENALVGTGQTKNVGTNTVARRMAGVQAMISTATTTTLTGTPILTEDHHMTANQNLYNGGAEADVFMVKPNDAVRIANFASRSDRRRDIGNTRKIVNVIDVLETPYGEQRVVLNRFLRTSDALLFSVENWKRLILRDWFRETLAKTGDSTRVMVVGEFSLMHANFGASALITGLAA